MSHSPAWDLIVIGGGAAGLWAAGTAAQRSLKVLVLEKNKKPGVKILMSGGTRCNITHHCGIDGIISAFGNQGRFLKPALHELPPSEVVTQVNRLGVATKVEDSGKVFPVSDRAIDVRDALVNRLTDAGANLSSGVAVTDLAFVENAWRVATSDSELFARNILLCCGGLSYAGCGTTGDGYAWARKAGHSIIQTFPALTPLVSPANWVHELKGVTLPDVEARVAIEGVKSKDPRMASRGGFLWTHFGASGPVPMNVSRFVSANSELKNKISLQIDLVPDCTEQALIAQFDSSKFGKANVATTIRNWVPKSLAALLLARAQLADSTTVAELPKKSRQSLVTDLKRLAVPLDGTRGYPKAEVTSGGVDVREVNPKTMESRLAPGLFLAGEILDIDGPIGGYNFQAAFSTGHMAGLNVGAANSVPSP